MIRVSDQPVHPDYHKYPAFDGEQMAVSTLHFDWMVMIKENLDLLTEGQDIFVASDLLWYPVVNQSNICKAPDVMVVFGRPKGNRLSYLQWHEGNTPPQVVFEVFSKSNRRGKNKENLLDFYAQYGVEEYYSFDPDNNEFIIRMRNNGGFSVLGSEESWVSPLLNIRFERREDSFKLYFPDGTPFRSRAELERKNKRLLEEYKELKALRRKDRERVVAEMKRANLAEAEKQQAIFEMQQAVAEKQQAESERQQAMAEKQRAESERQQAMAEKQRAESERQQAEAERQQAMAEKERAESEKQQAKAEMEAQKEIRLLLEQKLRSLGIDPGLD